METEKSCYNCKYFYRHYVMHTFSIRPTNCGHCSKRKINAKEKGKFPLENGCEMWEDIKIKIDERKGKIIVYLENMAKEIHDIALILKEDERSSSQ